MTFGKALDHVDRPGDKARAMEQSRMANLLQAEVDEAIAEWMDYPDTGVDVCTGCDYCYWGPP